MLEKILENMLAKISKEIEDNMTEIRKGFSFQDTCEIPDVEVKDIGMFKGGN